MTTNIDADERDADWLKTRRWLLPRDPERFLRAIGGADRLDDFMKRPAAEMTPDSLLAALHVSIAKLDFFTEDGVVHPIRDSEGYDSSIGDRTDRPGPSKENPMWPRQADARRMTDQQVRRVGRYIAKYRNRFLAAGGRIKPMAGPTERYEARRKVEDLRVALGIRSARQTSGVGFTTIALTNYNRVNIAYTANGDVAGAHGSRAGTDVIPSRPPGPGSWSRGTEAESIGHGYFASTGILPGTGSALAAEYIRQSATSDKAAVISPVPDAQPFWKSMGFAPMPSGYWGMTSADAKAVWATIQKATKDDEVDLTKYSDDQPRDDHGRWTSDGGEAAIAERMLPGTSGEFTKPEPGSWREGLGTPDVKTLSGMRQIHDAWSAVHPDTKVIMRSQSFAHNGPTVMRCMDQLDQLMKRFPQVKVATVDFRILPQNMLGRTTSRLGSESHIELDPSQLAKSFPTTNWWPSGTGTPEGITAHEFGHALDAALVEREQRLSSRADWPANCGYAQQGSNAERFATIFQAAYTSGSTSTQDGLSTAIVRLVDQTAARVWKVGTLRKYSEDQPRDERGRWTSEGGGEIAAVVNRGPGDAWRRWIAAGPTAEDKAKLGEVVAAYRAKYPDMSQEDAVTNLRLLLGRAPTDEEIARMGFDKPVSSLGPGIDTADPKAMSEALTQLGSLRDQFPQVGIGVVDVRDLAGFGEGPNTIAITTSGKESDIYLSHTWWNPETPGFPTRWAMNPPVGDRPFHVPGADTPAGYMTHEFGHAVENDLQARYDEAVIASSLHGGAPVTGAAADWGHYMNAVLPGLPALTDYGTTNVHEKFAEMFAAAYAPTSQWRDTPESVAFRSLIESLYKEGG